LQLHTDRVEGKCDYCYVTGLLGNEPIHRGKWRQSNLWSHYDLYVVPQHGVLCEVKCCRFVAG